MAPSQSAFITSPPNPSSHTLLSFPNPCILLVTLNRPDSLNCIHNVQHHELAAVWEWMDAEPRIRCGIITGRGRAFCAGADLKEWNTSNDEGESRSMPAAGFGGLSRRRGKKPVIAAVNGACLGGGMEMSVNCDLVIAAQSAVFGLPEVKVGVVALAGALPRLVRTVGRQRAMELCLTGRQARAEEMARWGIVNAVVDGNGEAVVERAVQLAERISENSPDSIIVSKMGLELGWDGVGVEEATESIVREGWRGMEGRENMKEGVKAFVEKRKARWVDSKL